jgi:tetratricopeptide (TPR) repeat protein
MGYIFADNSESQLAGFLRIIEEENHAIDATNEFQYEKLADLYASRGESYLIIGNNQEALKDFQTAYRYSQLCPTQEESIPLIFRSLLGVFLASICTEDLATAEKICISLEDILKNHLCSECLKTKIDSNLLASSFITSASPLLSKFCNQPD